MVKIIVLFVSLFAFVLGCNPGKSLSNGGAHSELGINTMEVSDIKVFTCLSGVSGEFREELNRKGIKRAILINGSYIDVKSNFEVQDLKIRNYLNKILPDTKTKALIIINIEGEKMNQLKSLNSSKEKIAIDYYIGVFKCLKKYRPQATIGIYGLPWRDYWNRNEKWQKENEDLLPIIKEVDALFPSVYDFYEDGIDVSSVSDSLYVDENIKENLRIAAYCNKPVYPMIWHRYHHSNKKRGLDFIDKNEFKNHVRAVADARYKGKKVEGIVWWSSEKYFYNISERGKQNKKNLTDFEIYSNKYGLEYLDFLLEGLTSHN